MEDMTFNTVAGQPVDRELLILFVNTGTDSAAVWSPLGTRVTTGRRSPTRIFSARPEPR